MMSFKGEHLHVISFDIPYPVNYGGVIDVYYKLKSLHEAGIKVHLHCYQYGRKPAAELEKLCESITYYQRKTYRDPFFGKLPYIVSSRNTDELLQDLLRDDYPILFEGLHCCYYLSHPALKERFKIVRTHNIEHIYYSNLARVEKNLFKKYFFGIESRRLRQFEKSLQNAELIAAISPQDAQYLQRKYGKTIYLPAFHPNSEVTAKAGFGNGVLYHGNLSVGENNEAALFLINEVFSGLDMPLTIAGMNPSAELKKACEEKDNVRLVTNFTSEQIYGEIEKAHINILPTFQSTGIKLKLINVLYQGRHCLVNPPMVKGTGLEKVCTIARNAEEFKEKLQALYGKPFTEAEIGARAELLVKFFGGHSNTNILLKEVYSYSTV